MKPTQRDMQRMLNDLGRAVVAALTASADVADALRRIRAEGCDLSLTLDAQQSDAAGAASASAQVALPAPLDAPAAKPSFRLDGQDVVLLRGLGIDPTRPAPRRRTEPN